jgi:hypothetical protein
MTRTPTGGHSSANLPDSDEHYTPPNVFEGLGLQFDLDVCAPVGGVPWIPAARHFSLQDDGLTQPWAGRVWMNPPYSKPSPWVDRFIEHGNGIAYVAVTRGMWYNKIWEVADAVCMDLYNSKGVRPDGHTKGNTFRQAFFALGAENAEALRRLNFSRVR